jgi:hypothetical protein
VRRQFHVRQRVSEPSRRLVLGSFEERLTKTQVEAGAAVLTTSRSEVLGIAHAHRRTVTVTARYL